MKAAFALSSGTIGAALSSSLSTVRSIALSYGTVLHPTPTTLFDPAHVLGRDIIKHLWDNWGADAGGLRDGEVDLYNVNIPLVEGLLSEDGLKIYWTTMWRKSYGRLFKQLEAENPVAAGPDAPIIAGDTSPKGLSFKWSPEMEGLINPAASSLPVGTDGWAIHMGSVSVTPLRASFAEPPSIEVQDIEDKVLKLKL